MLYCCIYTAKDLRIAAGIWLGVLLDGIPEAARAHSRITVVVVVVIIVVVVVVVVVVISALY